MNYAEQLRMKGTGTPNPEPIQPISTEDQENVNSILSKLEGLENYGSVRVCLAPNSLYNLNLNYPYTVTNVIYLLQQEGFIIEYLDIVELDDEVNIRLKWNVNKSQAPRIYDIYV